MKKYAMANRVLTMGVTLFVSLCWSTIVCCQQQERLIRYFTKPTVQQDIYSVHQILIDTSGTQAPKDTLFQLVSAEGNPVSYYRKIITEVCFDNTCRLLRVNLYWNVTGRYFGFELPSNEFLSKFQHEPFTIDEYLRLHSILADSLSPINSLSYQDLVPERPTVGILDGLTGPTSKDVLQYVVQGAVFTTYTTWNLIYGETQSKVAKATEQALNAGYLLNILNSPDTWDCYWALDRLNLLPDAPPEVKDRVLDFVCYDSYNLAVHALEAIPPGWCADPAFQQALWATFDCLQFALKPMLLRKIAVLDQPEESVLLDIACRLPQMNGTILTAALECLQTNLPGNRALIHHVRSLLNHENRFVANQAKKFLDGIRADKK